MPSVQNNKPTIFIQFAGQGVKYMDELRRLHTNYPAVRPFIQEAIEEIKRQASQFDDTHAGFFSEGLDIDRWIEQPETTPGIGYLLSSTLSHPLIYLCQITNYISIIQEGLDQEKLFKNTHSATGFSTGVIAAIVVSMGLPLDELCKLAIKVQAMFFWQGVRCQQSMLRFGVRPRILPELLDTIEGSPSCMASIDNLHKEQLDEAIESFSDYGIVHPAYEVLPERWIIAGLPENVAAFGHYVKEKVQDAGLKFIPSTIAAHCPFLDYALETSPVDAERVGLAFNSENMQFPVWSNDTGADLRESEDIIFDVMQAYFTHPALWRKQISSLSSCDSIKYVLDFGPGPGVASLTENHIKETDIKVIRTTVPLGRKILFDEVLRSLG